MTLNDLERQLTALSKVFMRAVTKRLMLESCGFCLPSLMTKFEGDLSTWLLKQGWDGFRLCDAISQKWCEIELR